MNTDWPRVSIITVNYNQLQLTCALLDSIRAAQYPNTEVWVVDNASQKDPSTYIRTYYPEANVIRSSKNLGFAGGNNLAVKRCTGDYIFFINNDAELTQGALEKLVALFEQKPQLGIVSPLICYYPSAETKHQKIIQYAGTTPVSNYTARNKTLHEGELYTQQFLTPQPTAYVHGAAMMTSRAVLKEVGMMYEGFFLYYEELDWCEQIRRAGYDIMVEPRAVVYHKESVTVGNSSPLKTYYLNRNRILFMRRNRTSGQVALFCLFLVFFTIPKNLLYYLFKGELANARALLKAIWWNVIHHNIAKDIPPPVAKKAFFSYFYKK